MALESIAGETRNAGAMDVRRSSILAAANELLAENGLEGLTIRAVLARTNLARRAFYDLFATKDDLVLALFEDAIAGAAQHLAEAAARLPGPTERLALIIHSVVASEDGPEGSEMAQRDRRSAAFSREHLRLAQARPNDLQRSIRPLVELIRRIIEEGIRAGEWHSPSPERSARFVYNLVSTTVHAEMLAPGSQCMLPGQRTDLAREVTRFCIGGLTKARDGKDALLAI
jgi:AcrR family transcriptional regulator